MIRKTIINIEMLSHFRGNCCSELDGDSHLCSCACRLRRLHVGVQLYAPISERVSGSYSFAKFLETNELHETVRTPDRRQHPRANANACGRPRNKRPRQAGRQLPCTQLPNASPPPPLPPRARAALSFLLSGGGGEGRRGGGEGGEIRRGEVQEAAHSRTCTRWLQVSATTMRPSLSMAMPP